MKLINTFAFLRTLIGFLLVGNSMSVGRSLFCGGFFVAFPLCEASPLLVFFFPTVVLSIEICDIVKYYTYLNYKLSTRVHNKQQGRVSTASTNLSTAYLEASKGIEEIMI